MFVDIMQSRVILQDDVFIMKGAEKDADCFDADDIHEMEEHRFDKAWTTPTLQRNEIYKHILECVLDENKPVVDIATGPSMGFIPAIKTKKPSLPCLAFDASGVLIQAWKRFFIERMKLPKVDLAQFSMFNIPFIDESIDIFTSYLGIGSTRNGEKGYDKALSELYRTLKPNGKIFAIEGEWIDKNSFLELFLRINQEPWQCFKEEGRTWKERFEAHGFEIISSDIAENHFFENDNDFVLSSAAKENNIKIGMSYKTYILKKEH